MAKLLSDFCVALQGEPAVLAFTLFFLFIAIGGAWMAGIRGRRRLWKDKVDKGYYDKQMVSFEKTMARIELRVWNLGTQKAQPPLLQETEDLANSK